MNKKLTAIQEKRSKEILIKHPKSKVRTKGSNHRRSSSMKMIENMNMKLKHRNLLMIRLLYLQARNLSKFL